MSKSLKKTGMALSIFIASQTTLLTNTAHANDGIIWNPDGSASFNFDDGGVDVGDVMVSLSENFSGSIPYIGPAVSTLIGFLAGSDDLDAESIWKMIEKRVQLEIDSSHIGQKRDFLQNKMGGVGGLLNEYKNDRERNLDAQTLWLRLNAIEVAISKDKNHFTAPHSTISFGKVDMIPLPYFMAYANIHIIVMHLIVETARVDFPDDYAKYVDKYNALIKEYREHALAAREKSYNWRVDQDYSYLDSNYFTENGCNLVCNDTYRIQGKYVDKVNGSRSYEIDIFNPIARYSQYQSVVAHQENRINNSKAQLEAKTQTLLTKLVNNVVSTWVYKDKNINSHTTPFNKTEHGNVVYLDRHVVNCQSKGLSSFRLQNNSTYNRIRYHYTCNDITLSDVYEKFTPFNDENQGHTVNLDRHDVNCGDTALTKFKLQRSSDLKNIRYNYSCSDTSLTDIETRYTHFSDSFNPQNFSHSAFLDRHPVDCGNRLLVNFKLERSSDGKKMRYRYACGSSS